MVVLHVLHPRRGLGEVTFSENELPKVEGVDGGEAPPLNADRRHFRLGVEARRIRTGC